MNEVCKVSRLHPGQVGVGMGGETFGLATRWLSFYRGRVINFLRFVGLMNAAVWLGGTLYHLLAVGPFFETPAVEWLLGAQHAHGVALMAFERFYLLHYLCLAISAVHLIAEWVYLGRGASRVTLTLVSIVFVLTAAGHIQLRRTVSPTHWQGQNLKIPAEERARAARTHPIWLTAWKVNNWLLGASVVFFAYRTLTQSNGPRFQTQTKFRTPDSLDP